MRRHVRPQDAERGPAVDRERDAVLRPGVGVEDHRHQDDRVAQEDREDRLPPVHPLGDQRRGEHVGRDAGRHRDPERGDVLRAPAPLLERRRGEVGIGIGRVGTSGRSRTVRRGASVSIGDGFPAWRSGCHRVRKRCSFDVEQALGRDPELGDDRQRQERERAERGLERTAQRLRGVVDLVELAADDVGVFEREQPGDRQRQDRPHGSLGDDDEAAAVLGQGPGRRRACRGDWSRRRSGCASRGRPTNRWLPATSGRSPRPGPGRAAPSRGAARCWRSGPRRARGRTPRRHRSASRAASPRRVTIWSGTISMTGQESLASGSRNADSSSGGRWTVFSWLSTGA